jgi:[ribosomal protein S5]-alanine N-acetyltransferase
MALLRHSVPSAGKDGSARRRCHAAPAVRQSYSWGTLFAPTHLQTRRLLLRAPTPADAEAVFAYASDPQATRYMAWPRHRELTDAHAFITSTLRAWEQHGVSAYLIEQAGAVIGSTGLDIQASGRTITGYILRREAWGRGIATEACRAMAALAGALELEEVTADCHSAHLASARVLEKAGFVLECVWPRQRVFPNLSPEAQDVRSYALRP